MNSSQCGTSWTEATLSITDKATGEVVDFGTIERFDIVTEDSKSEDAESYKFPTSASAAFKIKKIDKKLEYEILGIKNSYYKYLKRVKNRNKLHILKNRRK